MVMSGAPPSKTDVVIVGGGPAGLAAAIAARLRGFDVVVADRAEPPIEKACGEGLMPDGIAALRRLGVPLASEYGAPFRGIRFVDHDVEAEASFSAPDKYGFGIRRPLLHQILSERAQELGVVMWWHSPVEAFDTCGITIGRRKIACRWIIGADGLHSRVREWGGLAPTRIGSRRMGLRQHFHIKPWSDFVEVYWHNRCQAYVTPIGNDQICIALVGGAKALRFSELPALFPKLGERLERAQPVGPPRGALSMSVKLAAVTQGRIALVGDASGSVDAVTGEGLALAFRQAEFLASSLAAGNLAAYEAFHRRVTRLPRLLARALLLMDGHDGLRRSAMHILAAYPGVFNRLLAVHVGAHQWPAMSSGLLDSATRFVGATMALRRRV
jgi:flavin-dependent dehydrogenase